MQVKEIIVRPDLRVAYIQLHQGAVIKGKKVMYIHLVPTWTEQPGKMRKLFPVREKSENCKQPGKVREF